MVRAAQRWPGSALDLMTGEALVANGRATIQEQHAYNSLLLRIDLQKVDELQSSHGVSSICWMRRRSHFVIVISVTRQAG
jgi:hypothetical protein